MNGSKCHKTLFEISTIEVIFPSTGRRVMGGSLGSRETNLKTVCINYTRICIIHVLYKNLDLIIEYQIRKKVSWDALIRFHIVNPEHTVVQPQERLLLTKKICEIIYLILIIYANSLFFRASMKRGWLVEAYNRPIKSLPNTLNLLGIRKHF